MGNAMSIGGIGTQIVCREHRALTMGIELVTVIIVSFSTKDVRNGRKKSYIQWFL